MGRERCDGVLGSGSGYGNENPQSKRLPHSAEREVRLLPSTQRSVHRMVDEEGEVMEERTRKLIAEFKDCMNTFDKCIRELEEAIEELENGSERVSKE